MYLLCSVFYYHFHCYITSSVQVKNWVRELKKMLGEDICLTIAGNKEDLSKNRNIAPDVAQAWVPLRSLIGNRFYLSDGMVTKCWRLFRYAESVGAKHFLTSAKMNQGIEEMFLELSQRMIERSAEAESAAGAGSLGRTGSLRRNVVVVEDDMMSPPDNSVKGACCGGYRVASSWRGLHDCTSKVLAV